MLMAAIGAALALAACSAHGQEAPEAPARRDFPVGAFDRVTLAGSHDVIVTVGQPASVRAEGDSEALDRLDIRVEDGQLRIGSRGRGSWGWSGRNSSVTVYVAVPALTGAAVAGSGGMRVDSVEGESFRAAVAGSGNLSVGTVRVRQGSFAVSGSGNLRAAGSAARAEVSVTGSGDADLRGLDSRTAQVRVMGSGNANLRATETASVTSMGSGNVGITGGARCSVTKRGSGNVDCG